MTIERAYSRERERKKECSCRARKREGEFEGATGGVRRRGDKGEGKILISFLIP